MSSMDVCLESAEEIKLLDTIMQINDTDDFESHGT